MNYFIAVRWKTDRGRQLDATSLAQWLPVPADTCESWRSPNGRCEIHTFQRAEEHIAIPRLVAGPREAITTDGIVSTHQDHTQVQQTVADLQRRVLARAPSVADPLAGLHGEYSAAWCSDDALHATSVPVGCNPLYYEDHPDYLAVANRQSLLLEIQSGAPELDPVGLAWLCYQGYIQQEASPFLRIRRLPAGALLSSTAESGTRVAKRPLEITPASEAPSTEMTSGLLTDALGELIKGITYARDFHAARPWELPLSGGKDSRLILALLAAAGQLDTVESVFTNGPLYSPDVIAASQLCERLGIRDRHVVRRPPVVATSDRSVEDAATVALLMTEGRLSIFDSLGIPRRRTVIHVTGHQNGLRDNYYAACPTDSLTGFLDAVERSHFHDPLKLLRADVREQFRQRYRGIFESYARLGLPLSSLGDVYMVAERNANWVGVVNSAARAGGPCVNPLIGLPIVRAALRLSGDARRAELLHFALIQQAAPRLLDVPFADDLWSSRLRPLAGEVRASMRAPYRTHPSFPNLSNRYVTNFKLELVERLRPTMLSLMLKHRGRLADILDCDHARQTIATFEPNRVGSLVCGLGLYTVLLLCEYGVDSFHRARRHEVAANLGVRVHATTATRRGTRAENNGAASVGRHVDALVSMRATRDAEARAVAFPLSLCRDTTVAQDDSDIESRLKQHEDAIAQIVLERQAIETWASAVTGRSPDRSLPGPSAPWRRKLRKLQKDPVRFCADSVHPSLRMIGSALAFAVGLTRQADDN